MQAIYFPNNLLELKKGEQFYVKCNHDEYSLWFDIVNSKIPEYDLISNKINNTRKNHGKYTIETFLNEEIPKENNERSLGATIVSRNRLAQLNDKSQNDMFVTLLKKVFNLSSSRTFFNRF